MSNQGKVKLSEAARMAGVHLNTVKNWRKAGKLETCELFFEQGIQVWYVEPGEVVTLANQTRNKQPAYTDYPPGQSNPPETTTAPTAGQQTLDLIRESIVRPLTDLIERQNSTIAEQANRIGRLEAEVEQLKQGSRSQEAPQQAERPKDVSEQGHEPPQKRRWWQR